MIGSPWRLPPRETVWRRGTTKGVGIAITWRSTRITQISCYNSMEFGDEIYLLVNGLVIRPSGSPDYWPFQNGVDRFFDIPVVDGTPESGAQGHVTLMEQSGEHLQLGSVLLTYRPQGVEFTYGEWARRGQGVGGGPGLGDGVFPDFVESAQQVIFFFRCLYAVTFTTQERVV